MLSQEVRNRANAHLRLGEGFIISAAVGDGASEYEIRNAFSRTYYALFHVCYAHLLARQIDPVTVEAIAGSHGELQSKMQGVLGKWWGRFLQGARDDRRDSDYKPEWVVPAALAASNKLKRAKTQFYWLFYSTRNCLSS
jgi:uncharacterized protein (UPF0332 family)